MHDASGGRYDATDNRLALLALKSDMIVYVGINQRNIVPGSLSQAEAHLWGSTGMQEYSISEKVLVIVSIALIACTIQSLMYMGDGVLK